MDAVYFRIFKVFRVYFSKTEKSLIMTSFSVTSFKEGYFRVPGRFCADSNSAEIGSFVFVWTVQ
jgi:hypothetical protein